MTKNYYGSVVLPSPVKKSLDKVRTKLSSFKESDFVNSQLYSPSVHMFKRNGKLLRPTLVLLGAYLLDEDSQKYVDLALAAELMHTSSLIHDDIIDQDFKRGSIATVNKKYGKEAAVLAGDALISKAISISAKYGHAVMDAMAKSSLDMCAGELLDYNFQKKNMVPKVSEYLNIAGLKSASLIASCCNAAAVHKNSASAKKMHKFGKDLGIAFQIRDDIIDYEEWSRKGRKGVIVPNIVSSIKAADGISERQALLKAGELNEKYIRSAYQTIGNDASAKLLKDYANLIVMKS